MPDPLKFLTMLPQDRLAMMQPPPGPSGIAGFLQTPGLREGALMAGLRLLGSDQKRETFGQALGGAVTQGMTAYEEAKRRADYNTLLNESGMPEETRRLFSLMGPDRGALALAESSMAGPADPVQLAEGAQLYSPDGTLIAENERPADEPEALPADVRTMQWLMTQTPEVQASFKAQFGPQGPVNVNVNPQAGPFMQAIGENTAALIQGGATAAEAAASKIQAIDRIMDLTNQPAFRSVSGPIWGGRVGELRAQLAEDPTAREFLAEFNALGGMMTMQQLEAFTGPKTDFEFRQAKRLALNEPTMTAEEIRAGLAVHRRVAIAEAMKWANEMKAVDLRTLGADPQMVAPQLQLADRILTQFGGGTSYDPAGIR